MWYGLTGMDTNDHSEVPDPPRGLEYNAKAARLTDGHSLTARKRVCSTRKHAEGNTTALAIENMMDKQEPATHPR